MTRQISIQRYRWVYEHAREKFVVQEEDEDGIAAWDIPIALHKSAHQRRIDLRLDDELWMEPILVNFKI